MPTNTRLLDDWGCHEPSDLAATVARRRAAGLPVADIATANPQDHGFVFPQAALEDAVVTGLRKSARYAPDPRGQRRAREAVAAWHGGEAGAESVILTPGTSIAYFYVFRLLCEPGDEVLCPAPTYPLFDDLARLAGASLRSYHLRRDGTRWAIDPEEFAFQITPHTRAAVVVSPHNPTGTVASRGELEALCAIARSHRIALVFDEVFRSFLHTVTDVPRPAEFGAPLAVTLNGFSKMLSLPGLKAGWMVVEGDPAEAKRFLAALEYVSDAFLPVNEAVQAAIAPLLAAAPPIAEDFARRHSANMRAVAGAWRSAGFDAHVPEGGLALPVALSPGADAAALALGLLEEEGILVHPGALYGFPSPHLVATAANPDVVAHTRAAEWIRKRNETGKPR